MKELFNVRIGRKHYVKTRDEIKEEIRNVFMGVDMEAVTEEQLEKAVDLFCLPCKRRYAYKIKNRPHVNTSY